MDLLGRAFITGTLGVAGAYVLNLLFDYTENSLSMWGLTWVAFVVGALIGLNISRNNKKKSVADTDQHKN